MRKPAGILLFLMLVVSSAATLQALEGSEDPAADLLQRAWTRTLSAPLYYEESEYASFMGEVRLTTRRVWQASADRFRIESVDQAGRTVVTIADGRQLWVIDETTQSVLRERLNATPSASSPVPAGRTRLEQGVFADRPVHVVTVRQDRQTHRYTIDQATEVVLKEEIFAPGGDLLYMAYRSNVRMDPEFDPTLFVYQPSPGQAVTEDRSAWRTQLLVKDLSLKSGLAVHVPKELPAGYVLFEGSVHYVDDDPVVALHFRKGAGVLTIIQQEHSITEAMIRHVLRRLTSGARRELSAAAREACGRWYLAVGPLNLRELERVLASVECVPHM